MFRSVIFFFLKIAFFLSISGGIIAAALVYYYAQDLPGFSQLSHYHPPAVTRIYSSDGKLIEEYAKEHRVFVPISTIPTSLVEAFISAEDKNYYEHPGIDIFGILRASFVNISNILRGKRMEGASTITQQVVRNFLLSSERSLSRKIKEAILSYMISQSLTKEQILELYLNQIYLGHNSYGVAAAAQSYFNKSVEELSIEESAFLAALPKAPSSLDPRKRYESVKARRDYVLMRMVEDGYITARVAREAMDKPIALIKRDRSKTVTAGYYAERVREEIISKLGKEFFYNGGLTVITSMDSKYQEQAEVSLRKGIRAYDINKGYKGPITKISLEHWKENLKSLEATPSILEYKRAVILDLSDQSLKIGLESGSVSSIPLSEMKWALSNSKTPKDLFSKGDVVVVEELSKYYGLRQIPKVNGAIMAMHPFTGQVLAMVGGYDFAVSKFNRATQALRQPGSAIKPFVYLTAIEHGISPDTIFDDGPVSIHLGPGLPDWKPKNYSRKYLGEIPMSLGFAKSLNTITVKVGQEVGFNNVVNTIKEFGVNDNPTPYPSIVLGALETTLDRMTSAYCPFANGGLEVKPKFIELIKDSNGKIIYHRAAGICKDCDRNSMPIIVPEQHYRLIDTDNAYKINSLLKAAVEYGTAVRAKSIGKIMGGKTGSTNDSKSVWFVGFTPTIVVGTYVGFDSPKDLGKRATGSSVALPIYIDFVSNALKDVPSLPFDFSISSRYGSKTAKKEDYIDGIALIPEESSEYEVDDIFNRTLKEDSNNELY